MSRQQSCREAMESFLSIIIFSDHHHICTQSLLKNPLANACEKCLTGSVWHPSMVSYEWLPPFKTWNSPSCEFHAKHLSNETGLGHSISFPLLISRRRSYGTSWGLQRIQRCPLLPGGRGDCRWWQEPEQEPKKQVSLEDN